MRILAPCVALIAALCAGVAEAASPCDGAAPYGEPESTSAEADVVTVCKHSEDGSVAFFVTHYDRDRVAPRWVAYGLTREEMIANRTSKIVREKDAVSFAVDKEIETAGFESPSDDTYNGIRNKGYARGHYLPADAMKWSLEAFRSTFTVSNIGLQVGSFNSGIWSRLEDQERGWACDHKTIYVVTGVIFGGPRSTHWDSKTDPKYAIAVPTHFWKAVYTPEDGGKAIAVIFPNSKKPGDLAHAVRSVKALEKVAGLNFNPGLPPAMRKRIEAEAPDLDFWKLTYPSRFACRQ